ncbi:hypothetical protein QE152_g39377 [Popillia japonica]|uniref:HTH psq-type domain-containing protein n=1 Tax=Popillia japonica TaxID=7064 RepID=A0AAW1HUQ5_POPJA
MIDRGENYSKFATEFGIGKATVSDIKKNRANIMSYYSTTDKQPADRKTLKLSSNPAVEKALLTWFLQERTKDNAWKNVSTDLIKKSWSKVWPSENITDDLSDEDDEDDIPLARLVKKLAEVEKIPEIENDLQVICSLSRKLDEKLHNNEIEE